MSDLSTPERLAKRFLLLAGELASIARSGITEETKRIAVFGTKVTAGRMLHGISGDLIDTGFSPLIAPAMSVMSYNTEVQKRADELRALYPEKESANEIIVAEDA